MHAPPALHDKGPPQTKPSASSLPSNTQREKMRWKIPYLIPRGIIKSQAANASSAIAESLLAFLLWVWWLAGWMDD